MTNTDTRPEIRPLMKASFIAIAVDLFLIAFTYLLSVITDNPLLFADAVHSCGDLAVSFMVLFSIVIHHRFYKNAWASQAQRIVSLIVSFVLTYAGVKIVIDAFKGQQDTYSLKPSVILVIAIIGITGICLLILQMSRFKRRIGTKYKSEAFTAEGIHTYSDFLTSFGVLITFLLGYFGIHLERYMTMLIGILIVRIGLELFVKSLPFFLYLVQKLFSLFSWIFKRFLPGRFRDFTGKITTNTGHLIRDFFAGLLETRPFQWTKQHIISPFNKLNFNILRRMRRFENYIFVNGKKVSLITFFTFLLLYVGTGFYQVMPHQTGLELFLGGVTESNTAGLHIHAPKPFGDVIIVDSEVIQRLECGFRTQVYFYGYEPEAYLWEFTHNEGRYSKVESEAISVTGDENLFDGNFLCYFKVSDPIKYQLKTNNAKEILRTLFIREVHSLVAGYELDSIITTQRGDVEKELFSLMTEKVTSLDIGVNILKVHMQEAHPPVNVVPEYRAVASAREKKSEIIHKANAYANDLIPKSIGSADSLRLEAEGYAVEKVRIAEGEAEAFSLQQKGYSRHLTVHKERLWWENMEKVLKGKELYILPSKAEKRVFSSVKQLEDL